MTPDVLPVITQSCEVGRLTIELNPADPHASKTFELVSTLLESVGIAATVEERDESGTLILRAKETTAQLTLARPSRKAMRFDYDWIDPNTGERDMNCGLSLRDLLPEHARWAHLLGLGETRRTMNRKGIVVNLMRTR
jgi:hypothetical protein